MPPTLSEAVGRKAAYPPSLERLVAGLLEKRPEDRPQDLTEVVTALKSIQLRLLLDTAGIAKGRLQPRTPQA